MEKIVKVRRFSAIFRTISAIIMMEKGKQFLSEKEIKINMLTINQLNLAVPEGFDVLTAEELKNLNPLKEGDGGGAIRNSEKHIVVSAAWKKHGGLVSLLVSQDEGIEALEKQLAKALKPYGYVRDEFKKETVGAKEADAVVYHYEAQSVPMCAESIMVKDGGIYYYIHCYYRSELAEESRKVLEEIFKDSSWA